MGTPTFNLDDLRKVIQEQELAEQTESEGRRVPKEEGVLEVEAHSGTGSPHSEDERKPVVHLRTGCHPS